MRRRHGRQDAGGSAAHLLVFRAWLGAISRRDAVTITRERGGGDFVETGGAEREAQHHMMERIYLEERTYAKLANLTDGYTFTLVLA